MKTYTGVAITDGLNRKNHFLPTESLINAYEDAWRFGVPTNVGHDSTKFIGWTQLSGMYFEPGKSYVTNRLLLPETDEDKKLLQTYSAAYHIEKYVKERKADYDSLLAKLKELAIDTDLRIAPLESAVAYEGKDIVLKACPSVKVNEKDGLVPLSAMKNVLPGVFEIDGFLVFASRLFRRSGSLLNNLNEDFLSRYQKLPSELNPRISLDLDLIGLPGTARQEFEYQYWWGPKFDDDLSKIPSGVSRFGNEKYDKIFANISATEFFWHSQDDRKTFECEEINANPEIVDGEEKYRCRYVHSMMDAGMENVVHLDGAVRTYSDEKMLERMDTDISKAGHHTDYKKLWRIDGAIPVSQWKELITHYFRDNMLIGEYFHGEDEKFRQIVLEDKKKAPEIVPAKNYIPVDMHSGDGLRLFFNLGERRKLSLYDVSTTPIECMSLDNGDIFVPVIEAETITVLKYLQRQGLNVRMPYSKRIAHEDMVFNFPIFRCNTLEIGELLLRSMKKFCEIWSSDKDDRLISFTFTMPCGEEFIAKISIAGHVDDVNVVFDKMSSRYDDLSDIKKWLLSFHETNTKVAEGSKSKIAVDEILNTANYCLNFRRSFVPPSYIKDYYMKGNSVIAELVAQKDIVDEIYKLHLGIAPAFEVKKTICSKCGKDYFSCKDVKFIDDVFDSPEDIEYCGTFWTNRHA